MRHASSDMAIRLNTTPHNYFEAIAAVLGALGENLNPRKCLWCNYPIFDLEPAELQAKAQKDYGKLDKDLSPESLWYIGVPTFKITKRDIPSLHCAIALYYVATANERSFFGKLLPQASNFDAPISLIFPLADALIQGKNETPNSRIVERAPGYTSYGYLGKEWQLPDAWLGFTWALRQSNQGFEGLLEPLACSLMDRFLKELPEVVTEGKYEELVDALMGLGFPKLRAEEASRKTIENYPDAPLVEKIKLALQRYR